MRFAIKTIAVLAAALAMLTPMRSWSAETARIADVADAEGCYLTADQMQAMIAMVLDESTSTTQGYARLSGASFSGPILLPDGTVSIPSVAFLSEADGTGTGLYRIAAARLGVAVNGNTSADFATTGVFVPLGANFGFLGGAAGSASELNLTRGGTNGALRVNGGTGPTCTGNCGTAPSVAGNNSNMAVTIGTAPPAAANFTVTFNGTWTNAPYCLAQRGTTGTTPVVTGVVTTTTTAVVNLSANLVASETFRMICLGP